MIIIIIINLKLYFEINCLYRIAYIAYLHIKINKIYLITVLKI